MLSLFVIGGGLPRRTTRKRALRAPWKTALYNREARLRQFHDRGRIPYETGFHNSSRRCFYFYTSFNIIFIIRNDPGAVAPALGTVQAGHRATPQVAQPPARTAFPRFRAFSFPDAVSGEQLARQYYGVSP